MDFELPEELRMLQAQLHRLVDKEVVPIKRDAYEGPDRKPVRARLGKMTNKMGLWRCDTSCKESQAQAPDMEALVANSVSLSCRRNWVRYE